MSLTPLLPSPRRVSVFLAHFFALLPMNSPLPAELNFRENTAPPPHFYSLANDTYFHIKGFKMHHELILRISVLEA